MQFLVMTTLCVAMVADFVANLGAPFLFKYMPELLSAVITLFVLYHGIRSGFVLTPKYWFTFGALLLIILCGIVTNSVGTGPILGGLRFYMRAMPLFLVPAVYRFTPRQLQQQLKLFLFLGLVQVPLACYQRYIVWSEGRFSGDDVRGTVMDSGILSIILICIVLVLTGMVLQKRISRLRYVLLFFVLLLPTTINETKATVLFLPAGLLTTMVITAAPGKRFKILAIATTLLITFGAILIPVYDLMNARKHTQGDKNLVDFFTDEQSMSQYLNGKKDARLGTSKALSRGQAMHIAVDYLAHDPVRMAFGLGLGNVSKSSLGENFSGVYSGLFLNVGIMSFLVFLLEIGVLGVALVFVLYLLIFLDALAVARLDPEVTAGVAAGWVGTMIIITAATFYTLMHSYAAISFTFWYVSGLIAARRAQLLYAGQSSTVSPPPMPRLELTR